MIDWGAFLIVAVVSVAATAIVVALFGGGLRLLAAQQRATAARVGAYACFTVASAVVLFGVSLLIPHLYG
jgi:hypothetical protein